jgi:lysophospholipid acyltransferase (LPLAT)-like uncharacterized protein
MSREGGRAGEGTWAGRGGLRYEAGGTVGAALLSALLRTTRITILGREHLEGARREGPAVVALWHGDLLAPTWCYRHSGFATMASRSADGEYISRVLHRWGYAVARGSSSRGGDTALRELATLVEQGYSAALTADGPRGPRHRLKPGVLRLAAMTGAPVVAAACAAEGGWRFDSWDRFTLPRPFSRVTVAFGEPRTVPAELAGDALLAEAARLEEEMAALCRAAEASFR